MTRDLAIVQRFNPLGKLEHPIQYLVRNEALLKEGEWDWSEHRSLAWVFPTHLDADAEAKRQVYIDAEGVDHEALAVVLGNAFLEEERNHREEVQRDLARKAALTLQRLALAPDEVYEATSRRMGEQER